MREAESTRVTVHDVARLAGVASSTVSRAMTGGTVSPGTRQVVLAAADRLGYRPNRQARGLVTGRTGAIGLVVPDLRNPFFADVAKGVSVRARAVDVQVFVIDTDEDLRAEAEAIRSLVGSVDGLLLCSPRMTDDPLRLLLGTQAAVLIHRQVAGLPAVTADIVDGTRQAVAHLRALGHERIAYVGGPTTSWAGGQRTAGLADAGVEIIAFGPVAPTFDGGVAVADLVLASGASAVIAYNDLVALGLLQRVAARGILVPEGLSIVGYDDVSVASWVSPPLTTVRTPQAAAGRAAVDLMLRAMNEPAGTEPEHVVLPAQLVVRGSTGVLEPGRPRRVSDTPA
ncbi:MAG TPA: LacI family DNA-binding transcriptional regulator [Cellulomonas sp.]